MIIITMDATIAAKLSDAAGVVQLCDPCGKILGRFIPHRDPAEWEPLAPEPDEAELTRRELETESYSTAELIARLETLKCTGSNGGSLSS
jgi:hypothetical protein